MKQIIQIINKKNQNIEIDGSLSQEILVFLVVPKNQKVNCEMKFTNIKSNKDVITWVKILLLEKSHLNLSLDINVDINANKNIKNTKINWQANILTTGKSMAVINPIMKISTNKITANHGVSYHKINNDHLLYLQSRGKNLKASENILKYAFFQTDIEKITDLKQKSQVINYLKKSIQ